jgi:hypothetical protein
MKIRIDNDEIAQTLGARPAQFPKYASSLINLANRFAAGTVPAVVGQMSDLIQEFPGDSLQEWEAWYGAKCPEAIDRATGRITAKVEALKAALAQVDRDMVEVWVRDLLVTKTYTGLKFQAAILAAAARHLFVPYRLATPEEEARGIDGYLGEVPVSVKPATYKLRKMLPEEIACAVIYYEKKNDRVECEFDEALFTDQPAS